MHEETSGRCEEEKFEFLVVQNGRLRIDILNYPCSLFLSDGCA